MAIPVYYPNGILCTCKPEVQGSILYTLGSLPSHIAYLLNVILFSLRFIWIVN
jgi:hypothetical protein